MHEEVIPLLRVENAAGTAAWYGRLGFFEEWEHRFGPGIPAFVSVARGPVRLFLSEQEGDAKPDTLVYLRVADVDATAAEFGGGGRRPLGTGDLAQGPGRQQAAGIDTQELTTAGDGAAPR